MVSKRLLVFCDGTGMDGTLSSPLEQSTEDALSSTDGTLSSPHGQSQNTLKDVLSGITVPSLANMSLSSNRVFALISAILGRCSKYQHTSNLYRLASSVKPIDKKGIRQIVFYQSGIGAEADFDGNRVLGQLLFFQGLGTAVASKIRQAYLFLASNYEEGDEIFLFGGAYTARKLSGLIDMIGLLDPKGLRTFHETWTKLVNDKHTDSKNRTPPVGSRRARIKCIGVWDTVGSVFRTPNALGIEDKSLPENVDLALHALSLHENRKYFLPTLWESGAPPERLKQVWFPGNHSDVGGGLYSNNALGDLSLWWMVGEIQRLIALDIDHLKLGNTTTRANFVPHNSCKEFPIFLHCDRVDYIRQAPTFHDSLNTTARSLFLRGAQDFIAKHLHNLKMNWFVTTVPLIKMSTLTDQGIVPTYYTSRRVQGYTPPIEGHIPQTVPDEPRVARM